jgi:hypothetical protein
MREFDHDIQRALDARDPPGAALTDRAKAIEIEFAVKHRVAEQILREIVETLAKIGV